MKLLICDDDISVIDVIRSQIDFSALGIEEILVAFNGEMAKKVIAESAPELILCDIGMPGCDGIAVLKYVHSEGIGCEFTFLTCYEDFTYAQTAIRYGASGYLTKPFEMDDLRAEIVRMKKEYETRFGGEHQARSDAVLNSVLRQLSDGAYSGSRETVNSFLKANRISYEAESRWYMAASCCDMSDAIRAGWDRELLAYSTRRLHDEMLAGYIGNAYTLLNFDERYITDFCFVPADKTGRKELAGKCEELISFCTGHFSLSPTFVLSEEFMLSEAYTVKRALAVELVNLRFCSGRVFDISRVKEPEDSGVQLLNGDQVLWLLKKYDAEGFRSFIASAVESARSSASRLDLIRRDLVITLTKCLRDNDIDDRRLYSDPAVLRLEKESTSSPAALCRFADTLFDAAAALLKEHADAGDAILRVRNYIDIHFRENLDRSTLASIAFITPNYLSKQFQLRVGKNLREYMNDLRIAEAKKLLLSTRKSVSEIASSVGYDNFSYFSTIFRKYTGMSPVDWREKVSREGVE